MEGRWQRHSGLLVDGILTTIGEMLTSGWRFLSCQGEVCFPTGREEGTSNSTWESQEDLMSHWALEDGRQTFQENSGEGITVQANMKRVRCQIPAENSIARDD